jgi:MFS family permease
VAARPGLTFSHIGSQISLSGDRPHFAVNTPVASVLSFRALHFMRADPRLLAYGLLLTLSSGFGQTYFISIFSGEIREAFAIGNGEFGAIYSAGTLASAALLSWSGHWIDRIDLRRWTLIVVVLSAVACAAMASAQGVWMLVLGIFLLRHLGQGLMYHTAITSQGRYYESARGRAVATAGLGETMAEATFPLIAVATVAAIGWRNTWLVFGAGLIILLLPICLWLLRGHGRRHDSYLSGAGRDALASGGPAGSAPVHWTRKAVLRDSRFYFLLPVVLAPSFITTGFAFHQVFMAAAKGWALGDWAATYIGFAGASVVSGLALGALSDRIGATGLLPWLLPPLSLACLLLAISNDPLVAWGYMILAGTATGMANTFFGVFLPDVYGTRHLGSIRALAFSLTVMSSALSPVVMGAALDRGVTIEAMALVFAVYCALASVAAVPAMRLYQRSRRAS